MTYDIVTFGESMFRLTPPDDLRVEQTNSFNIYVAGSESNTAVGLARLGAKVNWFSRLPDSSIGKLIANRIREQGVDISHIVTAENERLGLYFVENGIAPRPIQVIYDRANSAMSKIHPGDLPVALFQKGNAKILHTTGITLALSASAKETTLQAINMAKQAGWLVSFDVNYRSKLWSATEARAACESCFQKVDIIFFPLRDARLLFNYSDRLSATDILTNLHDLYPQAIIVMSQGQEGSLCITSDGEIFSQKAFHVEGKYRIGAGDAFSAGFLYSHICRMDNLETSLSWGNATAAMKFTIPGDMPLVDKEQIESLVKDKSYKHLVR